MMIVALSIYLIGFTVNYNSSLEDLNLKYTNLKMNHETSAVSLQSYKEIDEGFKNEVVSLEQYEGMDEEFWDSLAD